MRRTILAAVLLCSVLAGCSGTQAPAAATSTSPATASTSPSPASAAAAALETCTSSDRGLATAFQAYETLMKSDTTFAQWTSDTSSVESAAQSAASFDSTFGVAGNAADASALAAALAVVQADLAQGVQTGDAPSAYPADVKVSLAAELPFAACAVSLPAS